MSGARKLRLKWETANPEACAWNLQTPNLRNICTPAACLHLAPEAAGYGRRGGWMACFFAAVSVVHLILPGHTALGRGFVAVASVCVAAWALWYR